MSFIAKEGSNELFIAIEPMTETIPILKRGMFCLAMRRRPEWEKVQDVAKFLREHCEEVVFFLARLTSSTPISEARRDDRRKFAKCYSVRGKSDGY